MRRLFIAAAAFSAFAAFASVPVIASTSKNTGSFEFTEFDDLTIKRNTMSHTYISRPLGNNCYIGFFLFDTEQLTVQSAIAGELKKQNNNPISIDGNELGNSTIGTDEVTQLKARLA